MVIHSRPGPPVRAGLSVFGVGNVQTISLHTAVLGASISLPSYTTEINQHQ